MLTLFDIPIWINLSRVAAAAVVETSDVCY